MTFIPLAAQAQKYEQCDILVVGDHDAASKGREEKLGTAEQGVLEQCLHMSGMTTRDICLMNIWGCVNLKGIWVDNSKPSKRFLTDAGKAGVKSFVDRVIPVVQPKVIVTMGPVATYAFLGRSDYTDIRGYPFDIGYAIVIPTNHPKDMVWTNYIWRFYTANDLLRARGFADGTLKVVHPKLIIPQTFAEAVEYLKHIGRQPKVCFDIEVSNYEVSCIGFSAERDIGISIPTDDRWSIEEETTLWSLMAEILGKPTSIYVGQNLPFDTYFLLYRMGVVTRGILHDTMMAHSIAYPDFLKGLGFLGSSYTTYTYWKDEMDFKNIKEES